MHCCDYWSSGALRVALNQLGDILILQQADSRTAADFKALSHALDRIFKEILINICFKVYHRTFFHRLW
jgi:hypothetical protein